MTEPKFEIYKDLVGKFRFRIVAPNGEILAESEAYDTKAGCQNGIKSVKMNVPKAMVQDRTE